jgi:putative acetyltransferase
MVNMKIRPALEEDYDAMVCLRDDTIRNVNSNDYSEDVIYNWANKASPQDFRKSAYNCKRWAAIDNNTIIGFCEHSLAGELSRIYVHKDYLRKGVGTRLLEVAETSLVKSGFTEVYIESTITAKDFYEKNGYKIIQKSSHKEDKSIVYKMFKSLSSI